MNGTYLRMFDMPLCPQTYGLRWSPPCRPLLPSPADLNGLPLAFQPLGRERIFGNAVPPAFQPFRGEWLEGFLPIARRPTACDGRLRAACCYRARQT
jgi:hypothetical protein